MAFKKRRYAPPNKNEEKVKRSINAEYRAQSAGTLGSRFPQVERLSVRLTFLSPQQHILGEETRTFKPSDISNFIALCPGRCGGGSFNIEAKIEEVVTARLPSSESGGKCQQTLYAGSPDICACELKCKMEASYFPEKAPEPESAAGESPGGPASPPPPPAVTP